jgi:hypothetical protein
MLKNVAFLLVAVTFTISEEVHSADPPRNQHVTAALYAGSLLLGTQLGVKKGAAEGKVPSSVASCLLALDASSLTDVVESVLADNLTQAELQAVDAFFGTTAGKNYAKLGSLGVYISVGETPPEDSPSISDAEYKEIEDFKSTAASNKLWKVLDGESARRVFGARLRALANSCGAGWP